MGENLKVVGVEALRDDFSVRRDLLKTERREIDLPGQSRRGWDPVWVSLPREIWKTAVRRLESHPARMTLHGHVAHARINAALDGPTSSCWPSAPSRQASAAVQAHIKLTRALGVLKALPLSYRLSIALEDLEDAAGLLDPETE